MQETQKGLSIFTYSAGIELIGTKKHEQLFGGCSQSIFRMCTPTQLLVTFKKPTFANVQTYYAFASFRGPNLEPTFYFQSHAEAAEP